MSQTTLEPKKQQKRKIEMNQKSQHKHKHKHKNKHKGDGPHEDFFGMIYAVTIWNILSDALFSHAWWAIIVNVVLSISLLSELIKFIQKRDEIKYYPYDTSTDDLTGVIMGAIIVNIVMNVFFPGEWWAEIPCSVLIISAVETGYEFYLTEQRKKREKRQQIPSTSRISQPQPIGTEESDESPAFDQSYYEKEAEEPQPIAIKSGKTREEELQEEVEKKGIKYCPVCGVEKERGAKFCPACGHRF